MKLRHGILHPGKEIFLSLAQLYDLFLYSFHFSLRSNNICEHPFFLFNQTANVTDDTSDASYWDWGYLPLFLFLGFGTVPHCPCRRCPGTCKPTATDPAQDSTCHLWCRSWWCGRKCGRLELILTSAAYPWEHQLPPGQRECRWVTLLCVSEQVMLLPSASPGSLTLGKALRRAKTAKEGSSGLSLWWSCPKGKQTIWWVLGIWLGPKLSHVFECDTGRNKWTPTRFKENI